ncbi:hypothetical protein [Desulfatiglans anilini]|uniref:hypothetical protein n=1 Tax=Desulfatiglans anilini TaxID=90728 RepID=UPI000481C51B|nr:hypothetical protein [Desulfatiglans anilini]
MKNGFLLIMLFAITGCAGYPLTQTDINREVNNNAATIILGANLGDGNIDGMAFALYIDGEKILPKGIVRNGIYKGSIPRKPILNPDPWDGITYTEADRDNHGYIIWNIDIEKFKNERESLIYLTSARSSETRIAPYMEQFFSSGYLLPIEASIQSFHANYLKSLQKIFRSDKDWYFLGCAFQLSKPGIYYLGEYTFINANLTQTEGFDFIEKLLTYKNRRIDTDNENVKNILTNAQISNRELYNFSSSWKEHDKSEWFSLLVLEQ